MTASLGPTSIAFAHAAEPLELAGAEAPCHRGSASAPLRSDASSSHALEMPARRAAVTVRTVSIAADRAAQTRAVKTRTALALSP